MAAPTGYETVSLETKRAVIVGGASGIGAATARIMSARGAEVVIADRSIGAADALAAELGEGASGIEVDVTDEASVQAAFDLVQASGGASIAVNAAGVSGEMIAMADLPSENWDQTIGVNLRGTFLVSKYALPLLLTNEASAIVNVSSGAGLRGVPMLGDYSASKHGVIGLTKSIVAEHARKGVRANVVCPGTIRTPMLENFAGGTEGMEAMGKYSPFRRLGEPYEVGEAIAWLCSDAASFVSGSVLEVDGGIAAL